MERYLHGKLTADEEQAFEEAYLADPGLLDELELTERLGSGFKDLGARGAIGSSGGSGRWVRIFSSPQYAAAASVLLAAALVVSGTLYRENLGLRQWEGIAAGSAVTRIVPVFAVRSDDASLVAAPADDEWTVLEVDPGVDYDSYRVVVTRLGDQGAEELYRRDGLTPHQDVLAIGMWGRLLTPGDYEIAIDARMNDWPQARGFEPISRIPVRVGARD